METVVVKCGGSVTADPQEVCADVSRLVASGHRVVVVHGGSTDIDGLAERLGVASRRMISPDGMSTRYTDDATLEVLLLALAGAVKPRLLTALGGGGVSAVGLTGLDGGLLRARRKRAHRVVVDGRVRIVRDDHSGRLVGVRGDLLRILLDAGHVPIVSPPALAEDGRPVNVDADRAAAAVAAELRASVLVLLTAVPGVLSDPGDETSVRDRCPVDGTGAPAGVGGGMRMKLVAAHAALLAGVPKVIIADGRTARPVCAALTGVGTEVVLAGSGEGSQVSR